MLTTPTIFVMILSIVCINDDFLLYILNKIKFYVSTE